MEEIISIKRELLDYISDELNIALLNIEGIEKGDEKALKQAKINISKAMDKINKINK